MQAFMQTAKGTLLSNSIKTKKKFKCQVKQMYLAKDSESYE